MMGVDGNVFGFSTMSVEKEKFRLGKCKFEFGSGVGWGPSENVGKYAF